MSCIGRFFKGYKIERGDNPSHEPVLVINFPVKRHSASNYEFAATQIEVTKEPQEKQKEKEKAFPKSTFTFSTKSMAKVVTSNAKSWLKGVPVDIIGSGEFAELVSYIQSVSN